MNDNLSRRSAQTTGRHLVLMKEGSEAAGMAELRAMDCVNSTSKKIAINFD